MVIDGAVIGFAERGDGRIEWVAPHFRLRAGPYDIALNLDFANGVVTVVGFRRAR